MKMDKPKITIVDYGLGNLFSLRRAIEHIGMEAAFATDARSVLEAEHLILPGVGAFGDGAQKLRERGLVEAIQKYAASGRPLLGICLGMQLLMTTSEEFGRHAGLNLIPGRVLRFPESLKCKVPNIGWCSIESIGAENSLWEGTVLNELRNGEYVYFAHSYFPVPEYPSAMLATTRYGKVSFCSVIRKENLYGTQFHPEKSGSAGLHILKNFAALTQLQSKED